MTLQQSCLDISNYLKTRVSNFSPCIFFFFFFYFIQRNVVCEMSNLRETWMLFSISPFSGARNQDNPFKNITQSTLGLFEFIFILNLNSIGKLLWQRFRTSGSNQLIFPLPPHTQLSLTDCAQYVARFGTSGWTITHGGDFMEMSGRARWRRR